jgi:methyl-accepting chemotaxis protein
VNRLNIAARIWLSIGVFVCGLVFTTALGQVQSVTTETALQTASEALFPAAQRSQEAEAAFQRMVKGFSDAVMTQDSSAVERAVEDGNQAISDWKTVAAIGGLSPERAAEGAKLASSLAQFVADAKGLYGSALANPASLTADMQERMRQLAGRTDALKTSLQQAKANFSGDLRGELSSIRSRSARQRWVALLLVSGTFVIAGIFVSLTIRRSITNVLTQAVAELRAAAAQTSTAANEISNSSQSLAQGSSEQAASLEEVSASGEQITAMTARNAEHSRSAAEKMSLAANQVDEANARLTEMMASMNDIDGSSVKVSKIIHAIDEIAFQTNILALNAAVEAARAGDAGMGFAVVANEVRNLAQRCAEAAQSTTTLIEESLSATKAGKSKLDRVAETIRSVTSTSGQVKTLVDEIRVASEEQARGMREVSNALSQMEQITQRNAAGAEESASAAAGLSSQSQSLEAVISHLVAMVEGGTSAT